MHLAVFLLWGNQASAPKVRRESRACSGGHKGRPYAVLLIQSVNTAPRGRRV